MSITEKVTMYWESNTVKLRYGGTKKKSKARTLRTDASTEGPRPVHADTPTTPSRYTMMMFDSSKYGNIAQDDAVQNTTTVAASP
jgi:hypothetical protein